MPLSRLILLTIAVILQSCDLSIESSDVECLAVAWLLADLLPSFLAGSKRSDDYTGPSIESRAKFPLRVFEAVRAAWPAEKPLGVRFAVGAPFVLGV